MRGAGPAGADHRTRRRPRRGARDVALAGAPGTLEERREEQAEVYRDVVTAAVGSKAGAAIVPWGFSDKFIQRGLNIRHLLPENTPTPLGLFDAA